MSQHNEDIFNLISMAEKNRGVNDFLHGDTEPETWDTKKERARREKIKNDNLESDQSMKKWSLIVLFIFLGLETIAVIVIIFLQGFTNNFYLEEWNFRVFLGATLTQIATMLHTAIKHLFPDPERTRKK